MSRPNKDKRPTDAQPGSGLFQAFAGLEIGGLPPGPEPQEPNPSTTPAPVKLGRVVLRRETAHRGGKTVLVIDGFDSSLDQKFIDALGKRLRIACGCGGSIQARSIELQGEQVARARNFLEAEGFRIAGER